MANPDHLEIMKQGVDAWNRWRHNNKHIAPDLSRADLKGEYLANANLQNTSLRRANLSEAILSGANLKQANLQNSDLQRIIADNVNLREADLSDANLSGASLQDSDMPDATFSRANLNKAVLSKSYLTKTKFIKADLSQSWLDGVDLGEANLNNANLQEAKCSDSNFTRAKLRGANLHNVRLDGAKLYWTDFTDAILTDCTLVGAVFIETNLENADISNSWIYGISAWNCKLDGCVQRNLEITSSHADRDGLRVDNLQVGQFIYMMLRNENFRDIIDTISTKAVLILGRFTDGRLTVLNAIRDELRKREYIPILFDFEKPLSRDLTETVSTLAHMVRFIIADITDAKSIPQELQAIVPNLPSVAVQPIILSKDHEYALFEHIQKYPWVLPVYEYEDQDHLITTLSAKVIEPAQQKAKDLRSGS